jgi:hypothetical protein
LLNIVARSKYLLPILLKKCSLSDDDDDENSSPIYEQDHAINLPVKKAFSRVGADSSKGAANKDDPLEVDFANYVLKCKSVYKCKLCPRIMCLSEDMVRVHLESKVNSSEESQCLCLVHSVKWRLRMYKQLETTIAETCSIKETTRKWQA